MGWLVISFGVRYLVSRLGPRANKLGGVEGPSRESLTHNSEAKKLSEMAFLSRSVPSVSTIKAASPHNYSHFGPHRALSSFIDASIDKKRGNHIPYFRTAITASSSFSGI